MPAGNHYYEEMAFVPLRIDPRREDFRELEMLYQRLSHPLDVQVVEDTDAAGARRAGCRRCWSRSSRRW